MAQVLLANRSWRTEVEARAQLDHTAQQVAEEWHWSLWHVRAFPWHDLEEDTRICLMHTWPGGSELGWLVEATDILRHSGTDWWDATEALRNWSQLSRAQIEADPYTAAKKLDDPRRVLAWRANPLRFLGVPRPEGLKLPQGGWLAVDEKNFHEWIGPDAPPPRAGGKKAPSGAGRRLDAESRSAIEMRAVDVALKWCAANGWAKASHVGHDKKPWDVEATVGTLQRYLEVKGTTGGLGAVDVTRNEVLAAVEHGASHAIAIVHHIRLSVGTRGEVKASGGQISVFDPWLPVDAELEVVGYRWKRNAVAPR